jgi:hypothetical protein
MGGVGMGQIGGIFTIFKWQLWRVSFRGNSKIAIVPKSY